MSRCYLVSFCLLSDKIFHLFLDFLKNHEDNIIKSTFLMQHKYGFQGNSFNRKFCILVNAQQINKKCFLIHFTANNYVKTHTMMILKYTVVFLNNSNLKYNQIIPSNSQIMILSSFLLFSPLLHQYNSSYARMIKVKCPMCKWRKCTLFTMKQLINWKNSKWSFQLISSNNWWQTLILGRRQAHFQLSES